MELSPEERKEFQRAFDILDHELIDCVTIKDLSATMHGLGKKVTDRECQAMVNDFDREGNGFISSESFMRGLSLRMCLPPDDDDLRDAFRIYDKQNTGFINIDQLRTVFIDLDQQASEEEFEEMIMIVDSDNDGLISFEDFVQMMTAK